MRTKKGVVTSAKMTGTVSVTVHRHVFHPIYKKRYRKSKKFLCDTNGLDLYVGDQVVIQECRPLSKSKCFKVTEITKAAPRVSDIKEDVAVEKVIHREKKGADADKKKESQESPAFAKATAGKQESKDSEESGDTSPQAEESVPKDTNATTP